MVNEVLAALMPREEVKIAVDAKIGVGRTYRINSK